MADALLVFGEQTVSSSVRLWERFAKHEADAIFTSLHRTNGENSEIEGSALRLQKFMLIFGK
jgi:hypothetical protein